VGAPVFKIGGWPRAAGIGGFDSHPLPSQTASYGAVFLLLFTSQTRTLLLLINQQSVPLKTGHSE